MTMTHTKLQSQGKADELAKLLGLQPFPEQSKGPRTIDALGSWKRKIPLADLGAVAAAFAAKYLPALVSAYVGTEIHRGNHNHWDVIVEGMSLITCTPYLQLYFLEFPSPLKAHLAEHHIKRIIAAFTPPNAKDREEKGEARTFEQDARFGDSCEFLVRVLMWQPLPTLSPLFLSPHDKNSFITLLNKFRKSSLRTATADLLLTLLEGPQKSKTGYETALAKLSLKRSEYEFQDAKLLPLSLELEEGKEKAKAKEGLKCGYNRSTPYGGCEEKENLFRCAGCRGVVYCSEQHQKNDWIAGHKRVCFRPSWAAKVGEGKGVKA